MNISAGDPQPLRVASRVVGSWLLREQNSDASQKEARERPLMIRRILPLYVECAGWHFFIPPAMVDSCMV